MYFYQNSWVALLSGWSVFRSLPNPTGPKSHGCYRSGEECEILKVWILLRDGWRSPWRSFFKIRYQPFCPKICWSKDWTTKPSWKFFHVFLLEFGQIFACLADAPMLDLSVSITTPRSWWFLGFHPSPMVPWLGRCPVAVLQIQDELCKRIEVAVVISTQTRWVSLHSLGSFFTHTDSSL